MQWCRVRGYHRLGREQGNTANHRDWDYESMLVSFQSLWQCTLRTHIRWASLSNQFGQTHIRGRRPECIRLYGLAQSVLLIVLTTWIEISYSKSSYKKPNISRYDKGIRFADGVWLTQEEHYSTGICFEVFFSSSMRCSYCVLLYTT